MNLQHATFGEKCIAFSEVIFARFQWNDRNRFKHIVRITNFVSTKHEHSRQIIHFRQLPVTSIGTADKNSHLFSMNSECNKPQCIRAPRMSEWMWRNRDCHCGQEMLHFSTSHPIVMASLRAAFKTQSANALTINHIFYLF